MFSATVHIAPNKNLRNIENDKNDKEFKLYKKVKLQKVTSWNRLCNALHFINLQHESNDTAMTLYILDGK